VEGEGVAKHLVEKLLCDRFLVKSEKVVLDTQPHLPVVVQSEHSELGLPYLKLFAHRPHIPQPYSILHLESKSQPLLLLEDAPIHRHDLPEATGINPCIGSTLPIEIAWSQAGALRQLNWLWQIAQLWEPLDTQDVASTLLQPSLIRVEGSLVRLLELSQAASGMKLGYLGRSWQHWIPDAHSEIREGLSRLCEQLISRKIATADQLIARLDQEIERVGRSQSVQFTVAAQTDQGPTRSRNEDACYLTDHNAFINLPLTVVCDGMGGHAGGDIASNLAIESISQDIQSVQIQDAQPHEITSALTKSLYATNHLINESNNQSQSHGSGRMGSTAVIALANPPKMYVASVGDSRAYWITQHGCHQITMDDNMATRWVRAGLGLYRETRHQPHGTSLIQALGVHDSESLHPNIYQVVIDEDCIFLLCSDGLSDYDRIEECWETELLPVLADELDLAVAARRLIDFANHKNGHDNVTVSLIHCRIFPRN
jgi:protein phosphatase